MRVKRLAVALSAVVLIAIAAPSAGATTIGIPSRAVWNASVTGAVNISFNGIAAPGSFVSFGAGPLALSGVSITSNGNMFVIDPAFYGAPYPNGGFLESDGAPSGVNVLTFSLPGPQTAVALDLGGLFGPTTPFTIALSNGDSIVVSNPTSIFGGSLGFIGLLSTVPFSSLTISMGDAPTFNAIDNFAFGTVITATPVPEPATLMLMAAGLAMLSGHSLRRRT